MPEPQGVRNDATLVTCIFEFIVLHKALICSCPGVAWSPCPEPRGAGQTRVSFPQAELQTGTQKERGSRRDNVSVDHEL